ncbi:MAG: hypothetical protein KDD82_09370 [Planctomycetes bacterium]|nr:hypothetical protein [Planctomycetota bacterium]
MTAPRRTSGERRRAPRGQAIPLQQTPTVVVAGGRPSPHLAELTAELARACAQQGRAAWLMDLPHAPARASALLARRAPDLPCWVSDGSAWSAQLDARRGGAVGGVLLVGAGAGTAAVPALAQAGVGLVVLEQRPQAVRSAYALLKRVVLADPTAAERLAFLVVPAHRPAKAKQIVAGLRDMARRFLAVELDDLEIAGIGAGDAERALGLRLLTRRVLARCARVAVSPSEVAVA